MCHTVHVGVCIRVGAFWFYGWGALLAADIRPGVATRLLSICAIANLMVTQALMPCVVVCVAVQVLKAVTAGLFMNAAQYQCTEYNPTKTNDAGSNVYRLLRHVQPRKCLWHPAAAATNVCSSSCSSSCVSTCWQDNQYSSRSKSCA